MLNKFTIQKSFAINEEGLGKIYTLNIRYINAILEFDFFREKGFENIYSVIVELKICVKNILNKHL